MSCDTLVRPLSGGTLQAYPAVALAETGAALVSEDPLIGQTIGSFRLIRKLGRGGMGTVYLGEHTVIGSKVAIKMLHEHLAGDAALVQRFYDEARAVNVIGHENIVSIFDMNVLPPRRYYLIMEYLEGKTLASLAKQPQEPAAVIPILTQVCDALEAAHGNGIVHRDLKPENVFLVRRNHTENFVKLMDFGIAKLLASESNAQTGAGLIIGTPEYMAPEQTSAQQVDGRADVYALGVIMYLLVTGRLPFTGGGIAGLLLAHRDKPPRPPDEVNPSLPKPFASLILKALAKRPDERFQSARQLREALEAFQASGAGVKVPVFAPVPAPEGVVTPEPIHSRHSASFQTRIVDPVSGQTRELTCSDVSRGGMFLASEGQLPPVFTRIKATLLLPDGPLDCTCEVVRHVTVDQARAWGMSPGFGVQFVETSAEFKARLDAVVRGLPHAKPPKAEKAPADDPRADEVLAFYAKRINGDQYVLLALPADAEFEQIRIRTRECKAELEALKNRRLSPRQSQQVDDLITRLSKVLEEISTPKARAKLDANRGNFRGVARCISAGLSVTELDSLRRDYASRHPSELSRAHLHFVTGKAWEGQANLLLAMDEYESALKQDPLNLELQQRYWALKKKLPGSRPRT